MEERSGQLAIANAIDLPKCRSFRPHWVLSTINPGIYLIYDDTKAIKATNCLVCDVPLGIYETRSIYDSECRCLGSMECT